MLQATTPTFRLTLPESVDLSIADTIMFSLTQGTTELHKELDQSAVDGQIVSVYLTQVETLQFVKGMAELQLNWTYSDGSRAGTEIAKVSVSPNLYTEVIE